MTKGAQVMIRNQKIAKKFVRYGEGAQLYSMSQSTFEKLAKEGELMSYMHKGFWQCMDNKREMDMLEKYLAAGTAPWKKW